MLIKKQKPFHVNYFEILENVNQRKLENCNEAKFLESLHLF